VYPVNPLSVILFFGVLAAALLYVAYSIYIDVNASDTRITTYLPFFLLFAALVVALGFEFVNGFHDTANTVATVIYAHAMPAPIAVVWSGFYNFLGVLLSFGAVAFGIISLLPVELILQVGSAAGFAMVFALLIAAMIWNIGTWPLRIQLAYADRLNHRGRRRQRAVARPGWHVGGGLEQGHRGRTGASAFADRRVRGGGGIFPRPALYRSQSGALFWAKGESAAAVVD
jgi:Phosphate transporter family